MTDPGRSQGFRQLLAVFHRTCCQEAGLSPANGIRGLPNHFFHLVRFCIRIFVRQVRSAVFLVRRNQAYRHAINLEQFRSAFPGGPCHPCQMRKPPEILLVRDRGNRTALLDHVQSFLNLQCLPEAVAIASSFHDPPGVRVHDLQAAVFDNIVRITVQHTVRLQSLIDQMVQSLVLREIRNPEKLFRVLLPQCCKHGSLLPFQHDIVDLCIQLRIILLIVQGLDLRGFQPADKAVRRKQILIRSLSGRGKDHRRHRFIQQDAVRFIHKHEIRRLLQLGVRIGQKLIPQIIKTELTVGTVKNIAAVSLHFLLMRHFRCGYADRKAQLFIHRAHPPAVACSQIGVGCCDPRRSLTGITHGRKNSRHCLSLPGLHLGSVSLRHRQCAVKLFIKGFEPQTPPDGNRSQRKQFFLSFLHREATQLLSLLKQLRIGQAAQGFLKPANSVYRTAVSQRNHAYTSFCLAALLLPPVGGE